MGKPAPSHSDSYGEIRLPAWNEVPHPGAPRIVALTLTALLLVALVLLLRLPWQQNVSGAGRIVAWAPEERRQLLEAPLEGRVTTWFVEEGDHVEAGEPIVEITDNDPMLLPRLLEEQDTLQNIVAENESRVAALQDRIQSVRSAQDGAIQVARQTARAAEQRLAENLQTLEAAEATLDTSAMQVGRVQALHEQGLISTRDLELAQLDLTRSLTGRDGRRSAVEASRADRDARQLDLVRLEAQGMADIQAAEVALAQAEAELSAQRANLIRLQSRISRQETQRVLAPRAGTILRVVARQGGEQVRAGDALVELVPDAENRAVEILIDGNDIPLVQQGRHVRIQFEGWPAAQFAGWPSVAVGTFGGTVAFVDATDNGYGDFRILVVPDPNSPAWPGTSFLRQGARANAWVLLDVVPLGYEVWRRFNGFPQSVQQPVYEDTTRPPITLGGDKG
ncbi:MAG: HlyD family efflux transporter periplasmic adaptor subunit [Myxococcales bacterium]|nr:HlyD family efflux transporter periplasmic adaptor subunit [Myxococcales bacterium]